MEKIIRIFYFLFSNEEDWIYFSVVKGELFLIKNKTWFDLYLFYDKETEGLILEYND